MIWFFCRDDRQIRVEIHRAQAGSGNELVASYPDGSEEVVEIECASALIGCARELQDGLMGEGWKPRIVLPPQCPSVRSAALVRRRAAAVQLP